jgi:hypothetical protein
MAVQEGKQALGMRVKLQAQFAEHLLHLGRVGQPCSWCSASQGLPVRSTKRSASRACLMGKAMIAALFATRLNSLMKKRRCSLRHMLQHIQGADQIKGIIRQGQGLARV